MTTLGSDIDAKDLQFPIAVVTGTESIKQRLVQFFRFLRGEWAFNVDAGLPYITGVFPAAHDQDLFAGILASYARNFPGVASVRPEIEVDPDTCQATFTANIILENGDEFTISEALGP